MTDPDLTLITPSTPERRQPVSTDHRAEAVRLTGIALYLRHHAIRHDAEFLEGLAATLADRCPDPAAHQAAAPGIDWHAAYQNSVGAAARGDHLRSRLREALDLGEQADDDEIVARAAYVTEQHEADDPAAHQAEDTGGHLLDWAHKIVTGNGYAVVAEGRRRAELDDHDDSRELLGKRAATIIELRHALAEARAARPAPMPPEVVAEAIQVLSSASAHGGCTEHVADAIVTLLDALPEGWRDGAAPAADPVNGCANAVVDAWADWDGDPCSDGMAAIGDAVEHLRRALSTREIADSFEAVPADDTAVRVPRVHLRSWAEFLRELVNQGAMRTLNAKDATEANAERIERWASTPASPTVPAVLDEAGVERAARLLAEQRGVTGKQYDALPSFTKTAGIERARAAVRAYLAADTDTGSEG